MPLYYFEIYDGYDVRQSDAVEMSDDCAAHREALCRAIDHTSESATSPDGSAIVVTVSDSRMDELMVVRLACRTEMTRPVEHRQ